MSKLYQLPDGWEWKKLGDLFTITSSKRVHKEDWLSSGVPFYRAREIVQLSKNGFVDNELFISEEMYGSFTAKFGYPLTDDILITGVGTLGVCYVVKDGDRFYFKDGNIIWLRKIVDITISRFIEYSFKTEHVRSQIYSNSGSTVATYTITNANNTNIPLPPLAEQKRIVQKLDALFERIDKAIALLQKNIDAVNNLMNSVLNDVFSDLEQNYPLLELDKTVDFGGKNIVAINNPGLIYLSLEDIEANTGKVINYRTVSEAGAIGTSVLFDNDCVLYSKLRPYLNKVIVPEVNGCATTELVVIKPHNNLFKFFVSYFLRNPIVVNFLNNDSMGAKMPRTNMKTFKKLNIPVPEYGKQVEVVNYLDNLSAQIEQVKSAQNQKMQTLLDLKSSSLDQTFHCKL